MSLAQKEDRLAQETTPLPPLLRSNEEVFAFVLQDPELQMFSPQEGFDPAISGVLHLKKDGTTKILCCVGASPDEFQSLRPAENDLSTLLILLGTSEVLNHKKFKMNQTNILTLSVPLTPQNLRLNLMNWHKLQLHGLRTEGTHQELKQAAEDVKYIMSISRELNGERDIPKLLNLILLKAREVTHADAGSIYTLEYLPHSSDPAEGVLHFRYTQNGSRSEDLGALKIPVNNKSIVGSAVINQISINIGDIYNPSQNESTRLYAVRHDRSVDQKLGYESRSMLTVPVFDISHRVIGVIQLINRKKDFKERLVQSADFQEKVIPFSKLDEEYAMIVAQQAGIALENAAMHEEIQKLFDGFVNASIKAIEQRDPTTSGHSHRVAAFTLELARVVDRLEVGIFKNVHFTEDQMREIEYSSLLHDFGKLGVREQVLVKSKKLYPWEMDVLRYRFDSIRYAVEIKYLNHMVKFLENKDQFSQGISPDLFMLERDQKLKEIEDYWAFILKANEPTILEQGGFERLNEISSLTYADSRGNEQPYLSAYERKSLSVAKGSLTKEEFEEIQSHVTHTYEFLRKIPWGRRLSNVPEIAGKHHEKLDGSGYPTAAEAQQIPIQSRMMTIADIFDALTAADRPYKKALPVEKALDIISDEVKVKKLDPDLFDIFVTSESYKKTVLPPKI